MSRPFVYVIAHDSLVSPESLFASYEKLQTTYETAVDNEGSDYFGTRPNSLWQEIPTSTLPWIEEKFVAKAIETAEVALDLVAFRRLMRSALDQSRKVQKLYNHTVEFDSAYVSRISARRGAA